MSPRNGHPLDRILSYEDLEGEDRRQADAHLAGCASCRGLLERCRGLEARAAAAAAPLRAAGDPGADPLAGLSAADRAAAVLSRDALLQRLPAGSRSVAWWRQGGASLGLLAVAAALTAAVLVGPWSRGDEPFEALRLAPAVVTRDTAPVLKPGDAVSVRFTTRREGWPAVVRVGAGGVEVLWPAGAAGFRVDRGRPVVLPPPGAVAPWIWSDPADRWFVILSDHPPDAGALAADLAAAADPVAALLARSSYAEEIALP